jgi:hypothetical protein
LNVSRLPIENSSPNGAGSCTGRVFKFHDFATSSFINPNPIVEPSRPTTCELNQSLWNQL